MTKIWLLAFALLSAVMSTSLAHAAAATCGPAETIVASVRAVKFEPFAQFHSTNDGDIVTLFRDSEGNVIVVGTFAQLGKACIYDGGNGLKLALPEYNKHDTIIDPAKPGSPT
jgi:hypothetical protein